jgi:hypothetical protein
MSALADLLVPSAERDPRDPLLRLGQLFGNDFSSAMLTENAFRPRSPAMTWNSSGIPGTRSLKSP